MMPPTGRPDTAEGPERQPAGLRIIAHVLPWPGVGGTEHATLRIAKAVEASGFASVAFCTSNAEPVTRLFRDAGVRCATYEPPVHSYRSFARFFAGSLTLAREFRKHRVDLVHCSDLLAGHHAALAGWLARVPVLCHIRNRFGDVSRRDASFLWPVRKFVFVSKNTWDGFGCRVLPSRGTVVYDGIDIPTCTGSEVEENRRSVCRELRLPEDAALIGMMARVAPQKDYPTLVRAAARVVQQHPRARFLVVGDHDSSEVYSAHYGEIRSLLQQHGVLESFVFTGYRQDVPRLLSALDIFVLSTHWEGLPLVVLEAMAHGKPVVATEVDGIPEAVQHGVTGLLCAHQDDTALAAHVNGLLQDPSLAAAIGAAGQRSVQERFSAARFAASMSAVYDETLRP